MPSRKNFFGNTQKQESSSRGIPRRQKPQLRMRAEKKAAPKNIFRRKLGKVLSSSKTAFLLIFFTILLFGGIIFLASFSVQEIKIARTDARMDVAQLGSYTKKYIGRSILLLSERQVKREMLPLFPQLENIRLEKNFPSTIRFVTTTHPVSFRWGCEESKKEIDDEGNIITNVIPRLYYVNRNGALTLPDESGEEAFLIHEKSPCPKTMNIGKKVIAPEMVAEILVMKELLEEVLQVPIIRSGYYREGREIHMISENETGFWIDFATPAEEQINKLKAALTLEPKLIEPMDHIDLRIPDKIFYAPKK